MVVMIGKEVFHPMALYKSAGLIKRYGQRAVACPNLKRLEPTLILLLDKLDQQPSISFALP